MRNSRFGHHGPKPCPPPSAPGVSTPSAACTLPLLPGLFHPGNALGVPSSGPCSAREARRLSRGRCSLAVRPTGPAPPPCGVGTSARRAAPEPCSSRASVPGGPKTGPGRCPPDVVPLQGSPRARCEVGSVPAPRLAAQDRPGLHDLAAAAASDPTHAPMRFRPCGPALRSVAHRASWLSPLRRRRPSWGFSPRPGRDLATASWFR
jgi:hypothetical protein